MAETSLTGQVRNGTGFANALKSLLPALSAIPLRISTSQEARDDGGRIQAAFATGIFKRLSAAAVVDSQFLKHGKRFWMLDDPVGNGRITITVRHRIGTFVGILRLR